ncbi:MAG TPA: acetyl-CoA carboxylase biotin carboxylase subunit, partial [Isosphaeraceae bacterium]
ATRDEAAARMRRALDELVVEGIKTTTPLHRRFFRDHDFLEGRVDTTWVEREFMPRRGRDAGSA